MKIEGVVVSCYRYDLQLTRLCVASIRNWYPDIPVWLLKDRQYGDFSTREIEEYWNVEVYPGRQKKLGWGFGKLEVMTELPRRRLLLLDSDTAFAGRVLDLLENFDEDFVVDNEEFDRRGVEEQFFPLEKLRQFDPSFEFPGFGFNTGQVAVTTGSITKKDFEGLVDWVARTVTHPEVFKKGEQGLLNYIILRKMRQGEVTLRRVPLMVWPGEAKRAEHIRLADLTAEGPHRQVIHWAGLGWGKPLKDMPRPEILLHFEKMYYGRVPMNAFLLHWRRSSQWVRSNVTFPLKAQARKAIAKFAE